MLRFSLAIVTALTIAVVGSIAWDAGQHLDDLWRRSGEGAQCARCNRIDASADFLPMESI
jgi:hypothetical protein